MTLVIKNANIDDQLLLYMRRKRVIEMSKVEKVIHLRFNFLKKRFELVIAASKRATTANIGDIIIHKALNIDKYLKNKK